MKYLSYGRYRVCKIKFFKIDFYDQISCKAEQGLDWLAIGFSPRKPVFDSRQF
jgi:hypothetical protein